MAINLSALAQGANTARSIANLILVSPQKTVGYQPQNAPSYQKNVAAQPSALLFNYEGEQSVTLASDITDHYIENNSAIQDQIALRPEKIMTHGFVGELNDIAPGPLKPLQTLAEKLTTIPGYTPQLSTTALLAYSQAFAAYQTAKAVGNSLVSLWGSINGDDNQSVINGGGITTASEFTQTKQQIYFAQLYGYWRNRTLFTIQTPWAVFQDMAIESLRAIQDADTRMITDFEVTFKLMRFATTAFLSGGLYSDNTNFQGRAAAQGARAVDLGTSALEPVSTSFIGTVTG